MSIPFLDPTNSFWRGLTRVMDLIGLTLCWILCSLPVVTVCASTTALYDAVYHGVRLGESGDYVRFFRTFRRELKTGILIALPAAAITLLYLALFFMSYSMAVAGDKAAGVAVYAYQWVFCIPLAVWLFACAMLSRFEFKPVQLLTTAGKLVFAHLPSALLLTVMVVLFAKVAVWWPISFFVLPGFAAFLASYLMERIFAPFLSEKGTAETE